MAESKKYYWLKLNRGFFKRHDVEFIKEMGEEKAEGNGDRYVLFYLKLLVESVDHDGCLRFSEAIPYTNRMLASATNTDIQIVNEAMDLFVELGLVEILEDKTLYMTNTGKMVGSETSWAEKKRTQRKKEDNVPRMSSNCPNDVPDVSSKCPIEKEIREKSEDTDDRERGDMSTAAPKKKPSKHRYGSEQNVLLTDEEYRKLQERFPDCDERIENMSVAIGIHGYKYDSHYLAIIKWASNDKKKSKQEKSSNPFLDMLQNGEC